MKRLLWMAVVLAAGVSARAEVVYENDFDDAVNDPTYGTMTQGDWDYAYRFSADGGLSWTYCDLEPGTTDGYQPEDAGHMTITSGVCSPNPCTEPQGEDFCDGDVLAVYPVPGACTDAEGTPLCEYDEPVLTDCTETGQLCDPVADDVPHP